MFGRSGHRGRGSRSKRARYEVDRDEEKATLVGSGDLKEAIRIPQPALKTPSWAERTLALIMSPGDRLQAQKHGLVGKPLLYGLLNFPPGTLTFGC